MGQYGMSDGDYVLLFFKYLFIATVIIIIGLFVVKPFLVPNEENVVYKCEKTPKMEAQERLLTELRDCSSKFGSDYRSMNQEYCETILSSIKYLIDQGHFELSTDESLLLTKQMNNTRDINAIIEKAKGKTEELDTAMDRVRATVDTIVGDI